METAPHSKDQPTGLRFLLLAPALAVIALYYRVLGFGYVFDDHVLQNMLLSHEDWSLWRTISQPLLEQPYFRPLSLLTVLVEQRLFDSDPFVPHLDSLLLHALNATLVAFLGLIVGKRLKWPVNQSIAAGVAAGLIYATHPALVQSASWISVRFDALMTCFCLLGLIGDRLIRSTSPRVVVVSVTFLAAALSKEMALSWALLLPVWHLLFLDSSRTPSSLVSIYVRNGNVALYCGIFVAGLCYLGMRAASQGSIYTDIVTDFPNEGLQRIGLVAKSLGGYVALTMWPFSTTGVLHYNALPIRLTEPLALLGIGSAILVIAGVAASVLRICDWRLVLPCCFVIALLPVLNVVPLKLSDNYVQDRFLTLPLSFAALWGGLLLVFLVLNQGNRLGRLIGIPIAVFWFAFSILNVVASVPTWRNDLTFAVISHAQEPSSVSGTFHLLHAYTNAGMYQEVVNVCDRLRQQNGPSLDPKLQLSYAAALGELGAIDRAFDNMRDALARLPPDSDPIWFHEANAGLGGLYLKAGQFDLAAVQFDKALQYSDSWAARYLLGLAQLAAGDKDIGQQTIATALATQREAIRKKRMADVPVLLEQFRRNANELGGASKVPSAAANGLPCSEGCDR